MKTGEGKTLTANHADVFTWPGRQSNFWTMSSNTYLALRDIEETGKVIVF